MITDTNDLFSLVLIERKYKLFRIDLDAYDLTKLEDIKNDPNSLFFEGTRIPVLEYDRDDVKNKQFSHLHCRGSSYKNTIDFDEKLIALFLHELDLYIWVQ